ncbi:MFS transporter [Altererythrobacter aerius]|uniref:MFS transporter n=1 Tax=Tsuneonella aeria TaxID=1837929 RepID=A0A6I4TCG5_9SPHN|nr:MFS transporter [Tsuneonella aeria]
MTEAQAARGTNPWLALFALLVVGIFNYADRFLVTGLVGPLKETFQVGDGFIGLLMGPAFVLLFVAAGVPIARIADRRSRVKIIALGCVMWSACTVATGLAVSPWQIALARVGVGVGEAAFAAPAYSLLADFFRPERRGLAFAILGLTTYIGQIAGQAGGPAVAAEYGWRTAFWGLGAAGLTFGLILPLIVKDPPRGGRVAPSATIPFRELIATLRAAPSYLLMALAFGLGSLSGVSFGFWGPEVFARAYGVDPVVAKSTFAGYFGIAGLTGMLAFGAVTDRLSKRSMQWPLRLGAIALFAATVCVLAATWAPSLTIAKALAIPSGLMGGGWSIGFLATLAYVLPDRFRATATALFLAATTLLGFFIGPWAAGQISQSLGNDAMSLRIGLSVTIPAGFVAAALAWIAMRRVEADRERLAQAAGDPGSPM